MEKTMPDFYNNKMAKDGSKFICLSVSSIDRVFKRGDNYYLRGFSEKCKHVVKVKKMPVYMTDDILMKKIKYRVRLLLY